MAPPDQIAIGHGRMALRKMTMVEKMDDPAAFRALRNEWDELLEASSANSFFLTCFMPGGSIFLEAGSFPS